MPVSLTSRDGEILDALAHRVRVLSLEQIGKTWWGECAEPNQPATARLKILAGEGLVGDLTPDFGAAAYRIQTRWTKPFTTVTCVIATKRTAALFGGCGGRRSRTSEQTHDIHLSAVFLRYRSTAPHLVPSWTSEAHILRGRTDRRERLPDALIEERGARRIVEFGGSYSKQKLAGFHDYCSIEGLPYEVW
jgi:hypothetical protein